MEALAGLLRDEEEEEAWRMYMAEVGRGILVRVNPAVKMPSWRELVSNKKPSSDQTGTEILNGIITQALGGVS